LLKVKNLETTYNDVILALKGISLEVPKGEIVALLGANGAGKTTTLNAISGIRKTKNLIIEDGEILIENDIINDETPHKIVKKGITHVPERRQVFSELTVDENIIIGSYPLKNRRKALERRDMVYTYFPSLKYRAKQMAGYLSGGEQQMLAIGRALGGNPKLIMLDEPSLGIAPMIVQEIFNIIAKISKEENLSILLVEQNANMALSIAQYGYILENGRIVMEGKSEILLKDRDIREFYLGLSDTGAKKNFRSVKHYKRRKRWLS